MSSPRVYLPEAGEPGTEVDLPPETANHLTRVLRLDPGAPVTVFTGRGGELEATLTGSPRRPAVHLERFRAVERESPLDAVLWAGLSKGEKMDWVVQKATELGAREIRPVQTARSVRRLDPGKAAKNRARWQRVAASACEQCGRNRVPAIGEVLGLEDALEEGVDHGLVLDAAGSPPETAPPPGLLHLLVGPEGGLTEAELAAAESAGFVRTALGPRTLRTETAALTALAWAQTLWGDLPGQGDPAPGSPQGPLSFTG